jgi:hypothetical protein
MIPRWGSAPRLNWLTDRQSQCDFDFDFEKQSSNTEVRRRCQRKKSEVRNEIFILCGVVTVIFRVLSLLAVTKCYSYSKIESVTISCSSACWTSSKSTYRARPASIVSNTRDNMFYVLYSFATYILTLVCNSEAYSYTHIFVITHTQALKQVRYKRTAWTMKSSIFWDITPYSPCKVNRRFGGTALLDTCVMWVFAWLILWPWRLSRDVPPKRPLTVNGLHGIKCKEIEFFITAAVRTSDP